MAGTATSPDVPLFDLRLTAQDVEAVVEVLRSGRLRQGERVAAFEAAFAAHLGVAHAVAVASGTAALRLAYLAAGVGPGDEVVVPAITFAATASVVVHCGARPVFADVAGADDLGVDPADVERCLGPRTRAVCAMHYAGDPAAVDRLRALCDAHGVALVEDAAHAPSAQLDGRALGTWGVAGAFSFFSNKVLSCGEGGLLATDDPDVAALARRLRDHGRTPGGDVDGPGLNHRLDEPRAALLLARLGRMAADVGRRRELTLRYRSLLAELPEVTVPYTDAEVARSSCYVMPVLVAPDRREAIREALRSRHGVQTSVLYPALHELTAFAPFADRPLPRAEHAGRAELTLPLHPHLDEPTQDRVVDALAEALAA